MKKSKSKKEKKVKIDGFELSVLFMGMFTLGMLVEKILIHGISWISTIGYFG